MIEPFGRIELRPMAHTSSSLKPFNPGTVSLSETSVGARTAFNPSLPIQTILLCIEQRKSTLIVVVSFRISLTLDPLNEDLSP